MNNTAKIITALAAGVVAGGVLGILFAPDKGAETRKKMTERGNKLANGLKHTFKEVQEKFECAEEAEKS